MCDWSSIRSIRAATGLPLADCRLLLRECGTVDAAIAHVAALRRAAQERASTASRAHRKLADAWWLRDFFSREAPALCSDPDESNKVWGQARSEYDRFLQGIVSPDLSSYSAITSANTDAPSPGDIADILGNRAYTLAEATHVLPRFEPTWLEELRSDPFARLRPLRDTCLAERTLRRAAVFDPRRASSEAPRTLAASVRQAEQYLDAATDVDLSVRPLLLYYAATNLTRAVLLTRLHDLLGKYRAHGLTWTYDGTGIAGCVINLTTQCGFIHAALKGLPGARIANSDGPWSLLELCRFIPELADTLLEYGIAPSRCHPLLDYASHHPNGIRLPGKFHVGLVLPLRYLQQCGVPWPDHKPSSDEAIALAQSVWKAFPDSHWHLGQTWETGVDRLRHSLELNDIVIPFIRHASGRRIQRRMYPLLYEGSLSGAWFAVFNEGRCRPSQLLVLLTALYGLSMLVRYRPSAWENMLAADDGTTALIEQLTRVASVKLPILATEWLLRRRVLGSDELIPH